MEMNDGSKVAAGQTAEARIREGRARGSCRGQNTNTPFLAEWLQWHYLQRTEVAPGSAAVTHLSGAELFLADVGSVYRRAVSFRTRQKEYFLMQRSAGLHL